ncbi:MAG: hypothetical protein D6705_19030, partial [Deltaproteobacteria bacterium]
PQPSESAGRSPEPEDTTAPGRDVLAAAPLVPGGPHRIVLADAESASPAWFEGARPDAVEPPGRAYFDRVVAEPRPGALPPSLASQVGREVVLYGPEGPVCRGRTGALVIVGLLHATDDELVDHLLADRPHRFEDDGRRMRLPPPDRRRLAFAEAPKVVAAPVVDLRGDCTGALWARAADLPPPLVARPTPDPADEARQRFLDTDDFRNALAYAVEGVPDPTRDAIVAEMRASVRAVGWASDDGHLFADTVTYEGDVTCGAIGPDAPVWVRRSGTPWTKLANYTRVLAVFDAERDGRIEALLESRFDHEGHVLLSLDPAGGTPTVRVDASVAFLGCPC